SLPDPSGVVSSARNRFAGLVTEVVVDGVMAQVSMQCGPLRVVSLMSAEACRQLELSPGTLATASVKATMVSIDTVPDDLTGTRSIAQQRTRFRKCGLEVDIDPHLRV